MNSRFLETTSASWRDTTAPEYTNYNNRGKNPDPECLYSPSQPSKK